VVNSQTVEQAQCHSRDGPRDERVIERGMEPVSCDKVRQPNARGGVLKHLERSLWGRWRGVAGQQEQDNKKRCSRHALPQLPLKV
jgi:hypothetical protein